MWMRSKHWFASSCGSNSISLRTYSRVVASKDPMKRTHPLLLVSALLLLAAAGVQAPAHAGSAEERTGGSSSKEQAQKDSSGTVQVAMKNVMYHFSDPIAAHIIRLQGRLTPTKAGSIVIFDDKNSFLLNLDSAEIAISCNSLAAVMNQNVFNAPDAPIKKVAISSKGNQLVIKGQLHSKHGVPSKWRVP